MTRRSARLVGPSGSSSRRCSVRTECGEKPVPARACFGSILNRLERVAELSLVRVEALVGHDGVAVEAQPDHREVLFREPSARAVHLLGRNADSGTAARASERQGKGGLGDDGRHHRGLGHHGESKAAGEAHSHRSDAAPAALVVHFACERAQPIHYGARSIRRPGGELATDADRLGHLRQSVARRDRLSRRPEETGKVHRHACRRDAVGEPDDERMQARHLVDDDHARTLASVKDGTRPPSIIELESFIAIEIVHEGHCSASKQARASLGSWQRPG